MSTISKVLVYHVLSCCDYGVSKGTIIYACYRIDIDLYILKEYIHKYRSIPRALIQVMHGAVVGAVRHCRREANMGKHAPDRREPKMQKKERKK